MRKLLSTLLLLCGVVRAEYPVYYAGFESWPFADSALADFTGETYQAWAAYNAICRGDQPYGGIDYMGAPDSTNRALWLTRGARDNRFEESMLISPVVTNLYGLVHVTFMLRNFGATINAASLYTTYATDPSTNYADTNVWQLIDTIEPPTYTNWTAYRYDFTNNLFRIMIRKEYGSSYLGLDCVEIRPVKLYQSFSEWTPGTTNHEGWSVAGSATVVDDHLTNKTPRSLLFPRFGLDSRLNLPDITNGIGTFFFYHCQPRLSSTNILFQKHLAGETWETLFSIPPTNVWTQTELTVNQYGPNRFRLFLPGANFRDIFIDDITATHPPAKVDITSAVAAGIYAKELYPVGPANVQATAIEYDAVSPDYWLYFKTNGVLSSNQVTAVGGLLSSTFSPAPARQTNEYWYECNYIDERGLSQTTSTVHGVYRTPPVYLKQSVLGY